jgi:cob(I)alamin adenosyltransferase
MKRGYYDTIILDELNVVLSYGLLSKEAVLQGLQERPPGLHVVVTGRGAPPELIEIADLVTEMKEIKHPFADQGLKARKGIEF